MLKLGEMVQNSGKRTRNIRIVVALLAITGYVVYYNLFVLNKETKRVEEQLVLEFNAITPYPHSAVNHSDKGYKDTIASVGNNFSAFADYEEVRKHYDLELAKRGWFFVSEQRLTDWGRDQGGKQAHYCKGDWSADLQYFGGGDKDGERHYGFGLSTGIYPC